MMDYAGKKEKADLSEILYIVNDASRKMQEVYDSYNLDSLNSTADFMRVKAIHEALDLQVRRLRAWEVERIVRE